MNEKEYLEFLNSLDEDLVININCFSNEIKFNKFHGNIKRIWKI